MHKSIVVLLLFLHASVFSIEVEYVQWGIMKVFSYNNEKNETIYKDCKVWGNTSKKWDWKEHGTSHEGGIHFKDLLDFIDEVDEVVLSAGVNGVLEIPQQTIKFLTDLKKIIHICRTPEAVKLFNKLAKQKKRVGGLFHSTC